MDNSNKHNKMEPLLKQGITLTDGIFEACEVETDPHKCKSNLKKRITYISDIYGISKAFTSKNWSIHSMDYTDDWTKCICGKLVKNSFIFYCNEKPDIYMRIGSVCVDKYNTDILEEMKLTPDHTFDTDKFKRTCSVCSDEKLVKQKFCGGSECNKDEREKLKIQKKLKDLSVKINELNERKITFGKFKGSILEDIDPSYLKWLEGAQTVDPKMIKIQKAIQQLKLYTKQWDELTKKIIILSPYEPVEEDYPEPSDHQRSDQSEGTHRS